MKEIWQIAKIVTEKKIMRGFAEELTPHAMHSNRSNGAIAF